MVDELKLERDFIHTQFSSWRLQRLAVVNRYQLYATGHASGVDTTALDFLHTRASVLRNHLLLSEGRLFIFTQSEKRPGYFVYELLPAPASDQGLLASQVAELGSDAGEGAAGGAVEAVVDCSLAVVAEAQAPAAGATVAPAAAAAAATPDAAGAEQVLLSRGHGDIVLMRRSGGGQVSYSNAVHPLRPRLPYTGVRPLVLEAAFAAENGDITAVVWAMRSKGPHLAACCEVFAVTLRPSKMAEPEPGREGAAAAAADDCAGGGGHPQLVTVGVRLLLRTKLPPHLVRVLPPQPRAQPRPGPGPSVPSQPAAPPSAVGDRVVLLGFEPNTAGLEDEGEEGGPAPMQVTSAGGGGAATVTAAPVDDDDDDMDPRTLEQAAARLAHMTSGEREGAAPPPQWADIYKESGPDGVGAMGDEPTIDLAAWRLPGGGNPGGGDGSGEGGDKAPVQALAPFRRLCCGAHRLLTAEGPVQSRSTPQTQTEPQPQAQPPLQQPLQPQAQPMLLLGVTDDVDCAVLRVDCWGGGGVQPSQGGQEAVQVQHAVSIPALAYVAAGKTYKRHLLLTSAGTSAAAAAFSTGGGGDGSSKCPLAAVLVESQRFMYLYGATSTQEEYGKQQVVELGLEEGETVLGARLVEAAAAAGGGNEGPLVVIATQRRLLSYRLRI